jgi:hypothetical protein
MSIWNKVLVGLNIVVAGAFFFFAAKALRAHDYWGESIKLHQDALVKVETEKKAILDGNPAEGKPGLRALKLEVDAMVLGRGRVWRNSEPQSVKADTGEVTVATQLAAPHKDARGAQLFVFEEPSAQAKGGYLGEFAVAAVGGPQWQLQPIRPMTKAELDRLQESLKRRAKWSLYEVMPNGAVETVAEAAVPAAAGDAAKPAEAPPAKPAVNPDSVDYRVLLGFFYRQRAQLDDQIAAATNDAKSVASSLAGAVQYLGAVQKDIASDKNGLKTMQAERDVVANHLAALEAKLGELKDAVQKTAQANLAAAREIARLQLEAIRRIDERTSKIAQAARAN